MFFVNVVEHILVLPPDRQNLPLTSAITGELEKLFLDKVIKDLGLCISIYGLKSLEGGFILPGEGGSTYTVMFGIIMFRPFVGEVLLGKVKESDINGLRCFFEDIYVPNDLLQHPCKLTQEGLWAWEYEDNEYEIPLDEEVRFRVTSVKYPPIPIEQAADAKPFAPMVLIGSIYGDGLGPPSWW